MTCERPKCYRTKSDKCVNPNSWILFLQKNGGKGLTRPELKNQYNAWKSTRFPSNSTPASRRELLCDDISSSPPSRSSKKSSSRKKTISKKVSRRKSSSSPQSDAHMIEVRARLRRLIKEDVERKRQEDATIRMASEDDRSHLDRDAILRNKKAADDLREKNRVERAARRLASNYTKVLRSLRKKATAKKEKLRLARKKSYRKKESEKIAALAEAAAAALQRVATLEMLAKERDLLRREQEKAVIQEQKAARLALVNASRFSVSPEMHGINRDLAVARSVQRTNELSTNNALERAIRRECGLSDTDLGKIMGIYPGANKIRRGENYCDYTQRIFGMGSMIPTTLFSVRDRFIIFNGLSDDANFVFIKVGLVNDRKTLKEFRYRTHIQREVKRAMGTRISLPVFKYSNIIGVARGKNAGIEATGGVRGNTSVLKFLAENKRAWPVVMTKLGQTLKKMHSRLVSHGDAHLDNFMYDSDGTGTIIPIDLERAIVFSEGGYIRSRKTIDEALMYDIKEAFMSIRQFVSNLYSKNNSESDYVPYLEKFTKGYMGKEDLQPREQLWNDRGINPEKLDWKFLQFLWTNKYSPILDGSIKSHWDGIRERSENNFNF